MTDSLFINKNNNTSVFKRVSHSQLYAFISENVNTTLGVKSFKLGDTTIGDKRLEQWRHEPVYSDLEKINFYPAEFYPEGYFEPVITRDYNTHKYFLQKGLQRAVDKYDLKGMSVEQFIYDYKTHDDINRLVDDSLDDIKKNFGVPGSPYKYLKTSDKTDIPVAHFDRVKDFPLREFQKNIVEKLGDYHKNNVNNNPISLLSAPTRSGKSHTSAYTAKTIVGNDNTSITLIVSGIAGVMTEWQETFESHVAFKDYYFYTVDDFKTDNNLIENARARGENHIVVFFTLQDLAGSNKDTGVKNAHQFLIQEEISMILADEAHWAALSNSKVLGAVLQEHNIQDSDGLTGFDNKHIKKASAVLGNLSPKYGVMYITATPYNALLSDVFDFNDDNTMIITKNDIKNEDMTWQKENPEEPIWKSPYFGIPDEYNFVIPTAVNPVELFKLDSNKNYIHNDQVESLFLGLFGINSSKYAPNIFSDPVYNNARLGNGIIITFSEKVETDIVEKMLKDKISDDFEIINISSAADNQFTKMSSSSVKKYIDDSEKKPIILTVERLMTGSTLKKIDTVVIARNMSSASALTQYKGRSGSPFVKTVSGLDDDGVEISEKVCVKPNCSTIYFDVSQAVEVVRTQVNYEVEHSHDGADGSDWLDTTNDHLEETPIFILDDDVMGLHKMDAQDILSVVLDSSNKDGSIHNMINMSSLNVRNILSDNDLLVMMNELDVFGNTTKSLKINLFDGELDTKKDSSLCWVADCNNLHDDGSHFCAAHNEEITRNKDNVESLAGDAPSSASQGEIRDARNKLKELRDKTANLVALLMLYAVLHDDKFVSVRQLNSSVNDPVNDDLVCHLGINRELLGKLIDSDVFTIGVDFSLSEIETIFERGSDRPFDTLRLALRSIGEFSPNEIMTPVNVVELLLGKVDWTTVTKDTTFIDHGCKSGIFIVSVYEKLLDLGFTHEEVRGNLYCVPTSGLTYELIHKVYVDYDLDVNNILFVDGVSCLEMNESMVRWVNNDMSDSDKDKQLIGLFDDVLKDLESDSGSVNVNDINTTNTTTNTSNKLFHYTISNPPYQMDTGGKRHQIYPNFWVNSWILSNKSIMIFPIGWQKSTGRASGSRFHKFMRADRSLFEVDNYYEDSKKNNIVLFPGIGTSGVNIVSRDDTINNNTVIFKEYGITIDPNKDMTVIKYWNDTTDKIFKKLESFMDDNRIPACNQLITGWNPNGIPGTVFNPLNKRKEYVIDCEKEKYVPIVNKKPNQGGREILYVPEDLNILKTKFIEKHKLCWTRNGPWASWRTCFYTDPYVGLSDAFLCAYFNSKKEVENFKTYFVSLFYRFASTETATNWDAMKKIHRHCPDLTTIVNPRTGLTGWNSDWTDDDLQELLKDYLTEEDWAYIKETALKSDNGRNI